jgi:hypothetical protein
LVVFLAFIKRNRMAEAFHTVRRKQSLSIMEILELTKRYIYQQLQHSGGETLNAQYHKQRFETVFQDPFFDEKSYLYTSITSVSQITEDSKESIPVKSFTR